MAFDKDIQNFTFEEALSALEAVITQLEDGHITLEDSIHAYEYGHKLKQLCEDKLKSAQLKIEKVMGVKDDEGNIVDASTGPMPHPS